jgi:hypothetical protein
MRLLADSGPGLTKFSDEAPNVIPIGAPVLSEEDTKVSVPRGPKTMKAGTEERYWITAVPDRAARQSMKQDLLFGSQCFETGCARKPVQIVISKDLWEARGGPDAGGEFSPLLLHDPPLEQVLKGKSAEHEVDRYVSIVPGASSSSLFPELVNPTVEATGGADQVSGTPPPRLGIEDHPLELGAVEVLSHCSAN